MITQTVDASNAGDTIAVIFKEAVAIGTLTDTFNELINRFNYDLFRKVLPYVAKGIKEGATCCGQAPDVKFYRIVDINAHFINICCGGCGVTTLIEGGKYNGTH